MSKQLLCISLLALAFSLACNRTPKSTEPPLFQLLRKADTGLNFENVLRQSSEFNVFNYMYFYNGGGVGAGDFNNDGLVDVYFTSNMGPNKMFLNQGGMKFRDITEAAGVVGCAETGLPPTGGAGGGLRLEDRHQHRRHQQRRPARSLRRPTR